MKRRLRTPLTVCGTFLLANVAHGQAFNIDIGGDRLVPPSESYGGGSGQTGFWNPVTRSGTLRDVFGNATNVGYGSDGGYQFLEVPGATGDDERLMESAVNVIPSEIAATLTNLTPGPYDLYVYCWGGSLLGSQHVGFSVDNGEQTVTGDITFGTVWPGGQVLGETYNRVRINILPEFGGFLMYMGPDSSKSFTVLNGLQLVPVPAPGSAALCFALGTLALRRKR